MPAGNSSTTTPPPRRRDPDRAERILAAAARLIASRGFHGVGMAEIGAEAGIVGSEKQGLWAYYYVRPGALDALAGWLGRPTSVAQAA